MSLFNLSNHINETYSNRNNSFDMTSEKGAVEYRPLTTVAHEIGSYIKSHYQRNTRNHKRGDPIYGAKLAHELIGDMRSFDKKYSEYRQSSSGRTHNIRDVFIADFDENPFSAGALDPCYTTLVRMKEKVRAAGLPLFTNFRYNLNNNHFQCIWYLKRSGHIAAYLDKWWMYVGGSEDDSTLSDFRINQRALSVKLGADVQYTGWQRQNPYHNEDGYRCVELSRSDVEVADIEAALSNTIDNNISSPSSSSYNRIVTLPSQVQQKHSKSYNDSHEVKAWKQLRTDMFKNWKCNLSDEDYADLMWAHLRDLGEANRNEWSSQIAATVKCTKRWVSAHYDEAKAHRSNKCNEAARIAKAAAYVHTYNAIYNIISSNSHLSYNRIVTLSYNEVKQLLKDNGVTMTQLSEELQITRAQIMVVINRKLSGIDDELMLKLMSSTYADADVRAALYDRYSQYISSSLHSSYNRIVTLSAQRSAQRSIQKLTQQQDMTRRDVRDKIASRYAETKL